MPSARSSLVVLISHIIIMIIAKVVVDSVGTLEGPADPGTE